MILPISTIYKRGEQMLYIGIIFILLGVYNIFSDIFDIKIFFKEGKISKDKCFKLDEYDNIKIVVGIFAIIVGLLSLANYFYY
ncbi:hypothetical protein [Proteiniborus ethanoligenes]|uniref:hypothetical protein n=1 Tax=Proteiniborus ethanoligenes TaxID=415015 RepID=UPI0015A13DEA|nr:hypothetical protein [Proteiniborus ethanoligenes]